MDKMDLNAMILKQYRQALIFSRIASYRREAVFLLSQNGKKQISHFGKVGSFTYPIHTSHTGKTRVSQFGK